MRLFRRLAVKQAVQDLSPAVGRGATVELELVQVEALLRLVGAHQ